MYGFGQGCDERTDFVIHGETKRLEGFRRRMDLLRVLPGWNCGCDNFGKFSCGVNSMLP